MVFLKNYKKIVAMCAMICLIVICYYSQNYINSFAEEKDDFIKVGIFYGAGSPENWDVYFNNGISVGYIEKNNFVEVNKFYDINKVNIKMVGNTLKVEGVNKEGNLLDISSISNEINAIMPVDYKSGDYFMIMERPYRGGLVFNNLQDSLNIINYISVEEYLYGVLNGELNSTNPKEALKAQAVAARSFALSKISQHRQYGFDVCNKSHCQLYKGMRDEKSETTEAVDETRGERLIHNGKIACGFFFKNSGGHTQDVEDVWGSKHSYLKGIKDEYSPKYLWKKEYTFSEISRKLQDKNIYLGSLKKINITKYKKSGAVEEIEFTGDSGEKVFKNQEIRRIFGYSDIKSMMFGFSERSWQSENNNKSKDNDNRENNSENESITLISYINQKTSFKGRMKIIDGLQNIFEKNVDEINLFNENNKGVNYDNENEVNKEIDKENISKENEEVRREQGNITIYGRGFGHGVGMPQDSIVQMAKEGKNYIDILMYYYTDIEVK